MAKVDGAGERKKRAKKLMLCAPEQAQEPVQPSLPEGGAGSSQGGASAASPRKKQVHVLVCRKRRADDPASFLEFIPISECLVLCGVVW